MKSQTGTELAARDDQVAVQRQHRVGLGGLLRHPAPLDRDRRQPWLGVRVGEAAVRLGGVPEHRVAVGVAAGAIAGGSPPGPSAIPISSP